MSSQFRNVWLNFDDLKRVAIVPISALGQNFRDKKNIQTIDDYGLKAALFEKISQPLQEGRLHGNYPNLSRKGVLGVKILLIHAAKTEEFN